MTSHTKGTWHSCIRSHQNFFSYKNSRQNFFSRKITMITNFDSEYVQCISKPLTYDQLGDMYEKATGRKARIGPLEAVREWAENNPEWFYVCPIETTIHKIGYAKPLPKLDK